MYCRKSVSELLKNELVFIHTPKCAGTYISNILSYLKIKNEGHNQAIVNNKRIYFTVIRDPVERFESLLNYRLGEKEPRNDWPKQLLYVYHDQNITLDDIISKMSDKDILGFSPYKTLKYWTKNVDIIITLDNLPKLLKYFGYTYDINSFTPVNISNKIRGRINSENQNRLKKIFKDDLKLYKKVVNSDIKI